VTERGDKHREDDEGDALMGYFDRKNGRAFGESAPPIGTPAHAAYQRGWFEAEEEKAQD
jgi:hypothetical protein